MFRERAGAQDDAVGQQHRAHASRRGADHGPKGVSLLRQALDVPRDAVPNDARIHEGETQHPPEPAEPYHVAEQLADERRAGDG